MRHGHEPEPAAAPSAQAGAKVRAVTDRVQLSSTLVSAAIAYAHKRGADLSELAARLGLPDVTAALPPLVTPGQARELLDEVARVLDDPLLGIHVAQSIEKGAYGVADFAARSAPDFRGALERVVRFIALVSAPAEAELAKAPGGMAIRFRFPGIKGTLGRHGNEFFIALMWQTGLRLTGASFRPTRVRFEHSPPADRRIVERFFEIPVVEFDANWNEIAFDEDALVLPVIGHEPRLLPLLDQMAEQEMASRRSARGLVDQVADHVRASLDKGEPALEDVARALGMSGRTLQRRLNDEAKPFAEVVDSVRSELACLYVREAERSLDDIAGLLGYAGSRPFQRAFKRWTGMTPFEYRKSQTKPS
jgi:AraC-like DNA-binding protein